MAYLPAFALLLMTLSFSCSSGDWSTYGGRRYYCRDRYGYIGDCRKSYYGSGGYGYSQERQTYGTRVGTGYYNLVGGRNAELVCDFGRDGGVRDVRNAVWRKVSDCYGDNDLWGRRGRGHSDFSDWYSNEDYRSSSRVFTQDDKTTLYIRDFRDADKGVYQCVATANSFYRRRHNAVYMQVAICPYKYK